jgi:hypothetical protein
VGGSSLALAVGGFVGDRVDPVPAQTAPISCSDPGHDRDLTQETKENPIFEIERYAPAIAQKLKLPDLDVPQADPACPQDKANVVATAEQMVTDGELGSASTDSSG